MRRCGRRGPKTDTCSYGRARRTAHPSLAGSWTKKGPAHGWVVAIHVPGTASKALGVVVLGVVDEVIGSELAGQLDGPWSTHGRDFGPERLGYLDGVDPDTTGGSVDESPLVGVDLPRVADSSQRGNTGYRNGGRLLEGERGRLGRHPFGSRHNVLRAGVAVGLTKDLIAGLDSRHVLADRLHDSGKVKTRDMSSSAGAARSAAATQVTSSPRIR